MFCQKHYISALKWPNLNHGIISQRFSEIRIPPAKSAHCLLWNKNKSDFFFTPFQYCLLSSNYIAITSFPLFTIIHSLTYQILQDSSTQSHLHYGLPLLLIAQYTVEHLPLPEKQALLLNHHTAYKWRCNSLQE